MSDFILINGDQVTFKPAFGAATVMVQPGQLAGTGKASVAGQPVCVSGDEKKVKVPDCAYTTQTHTIPGVGTLSIKALGDDQTAKTLSCGGNPVLLKGSTFTASFRVATPAQVPGPPPTPDPTPLYQGTGSFVNSNQSVTGS